MKNFPLRKFDSEVWIRIHQIIERKEKNEAMEGIVGENFVCKNIIVELLIFKIY